jgi:Holliday junction resolvase RusA-like endonuclease
MDATSITFTVIGAAVPQPRVRATRTGRMYTPTKNGIAVYKQAIVLATSSAARSAGWSATDDPHEIAIEAIFDRPPSHLTRSGELRGGVPAYPGRRNGDNDNIEKGVWDAVTESQAVWFDDSQIVGNSTRKRYAKPGEKARTVVVIRRPDT